MSTKPRATREYMSPAARPPITTSARNVGAPSMSFTGPTPPAYSRSSMRHPEVGVDDTLVRPHLIRPAVSDLAPVVERDHPVRDVHDHAHVVLDERDSGAELVVDAEDEAAHVFLLLDVHPRHRLPPRPRLWRGPQGARGH